MIKHIKKFIIVPLVHISNRSFVTGIFPSELKIANVVPIYKSGDEMVLIANVVPIYRSGDEMVFPNYRHVSDCLYSPSYCRDLCMIV